jgi:hypothetical protein
MEKEIESSKLEENAKSSISSKHIKEMEEAKEEQGAQRLQQIASKSVKGTELAKSLGIC